MKYICTLLLLLFCPALLSGQDNRQSVPPKFEERQPGTARLSNGVRRDGSVFSPAGERFMDFLKECGIAVYTTAPSSRNMTLEIKQVETVHQTPTEAFNAYSIRITPTRITIEYQNTQAERMAYRQFTDYFRKNATRQGLMRKNIVIPCCEIRDWMTEQDRIVFRWKAPGTAVPLRSTTVEMMLTDPANGWIGANQVLQAVGYPPCLYTGSAYTYAELNKEIQKIAAEGPEVLPLFDLTTPNPLFETVTGHPALSVEGMRFVRLLLDAYFSEIDFPTVGFIVPEGRYREQITGIVALYPRITDLRFLDPQ